MVEKNNLQLEFVWLEQDKTNCVYMEGKYYCVYMDGKYSIIQF